jgi:DNA-binding beta-propeller fold protein YncE
VKLWQIVSRAVALGCAALALALPVPAAAAEPPNHPFRFAISEFFVPEPSPGHLEVLEGPCGVALDSAGDIYVADYYHDQIAIFGPTGSYITRITGVDPTDGPCALAVGADGSLFVDDYHGDVIRLTPSHFPPQGTTTYGGRLQIDPGPATGLALDPADGNLLIDARTRITEREPSGGLIRSFGEGALGDAYGVAVSGFPATLGEVYVADASTGTVKVFDPSGALEPEIDGAGTPQGGFASLVDAALAVDDSDGHLFVTDDLQSLDTEHPRGALEEFTAAGAYRGGLPAAPTLLAGEPAGLAIDNFGGAGQGDVYITSGNSEKSSVYAYGPTGPAHTLTVTKSGEGEGVLRSEPAGIDCGSACAAEYDAGAEVTLTATPTSGSVFSAWTGCPAPSGPTCTVALGTDQIVGAEFEPGAEPLAFRSAPTVQSSSTSALPSVAAAFSLRQQSVAADSASIEITLPDAGTVSLHGRFLRPISRQAHGSAVRMGVHLDRSGSRVLARSKVGELAVDVHAKFRPSGGGAALAATRRIVFRADRLRSKR